MERIVMLGWFAIAIVARPFGGRLWLYARLREWHIQNRIDGSLARLRAVYEKYQRDLR